MKGGFSSNPLRKSSGFAGSLPVNHKQNVLGLDKAYASNSNLHLDGDTLYIAGTKTLGDVWDDLKLPFHKTQQTQRYKEAQAVIEKNPQITNLVAHSLGSAVSTELQQTHSKKQLKSVQYGAPLFRPFGNTDDNTQSFRHPFDPVSAFNNNATTIGNYSVGSFFKPLTNHSYTNV